MLAPSKCVLHFAAMRPVLFCFFTLLSCSLIGLTIGCRSKGNLNPDAADLLVRNGRVYTVDSDRPWAQAVAVRGDRIAWVGDEKDAGRFIGPATRVIDASGKMVLPGFIDSHFHLSLIHI